MRKDPQLGARFIAVALLASFCSMAGCKGGTLASGPTSQRPYDAPSTSPTTSGDATPAPFIGDLTSASERETAIASLRWVAPATRANGSKLYIGEISGYRIYYKLRHQDAYRVIDVDDAASTSFTLEGFKPGVYEFAVSTLDVEGLESQRSEVVSVNII